MKKIISFITMLSLFFTSALFAAPQTSTIELSVSNGGLVKPTVKASIALDKLLPQVSYIVTCKINNPNPEAIDVNFDMEVYTGPGVTLYLNGYTTLAQRRLDKTSRNTYQVVNVYKKIVALTIQNLDWDNSLEVQKCKAYPTVS